MTSIVKEETVGFILPTNKINAKAVEKVNRFLPELDEKTKAFDRKNSQTTLALMTLTMLCGHSPYRMMRQIMAEVEKRKLALSEAQVTYAKQQRKIDKLQDAEDPVKKAEYRSACVSLTTMENKVNGSFKDIAMLIDAYNGIKERNGITDWDEQAFEEEEKKHHVRRAFELMYRNILDGSRASTSTIEYCQQFGIHPQVCLAETAAYVEAAAQLIKTGAKPHANDLEEFLDRMSDKYYKNVDGTAERLFGKSDFTVTDYMYKTVTK